MKKKPTRKTLPKNLDELLTEAEKTGKYDKVYEVLEKCIPDARGGYGKGTLLMNRLCTFEMAKWAIARGTNINAGDTWGYTALHESARSRFHRTLTPAQLIELGADVNATSNEGVTPLHSAVDGKNLAAVQVLVQNGADINSNDVIGLTPLEYGLERMSNIDFVYMLPIAEYLLESGAKVTQISKEAVKRSGKNFEFHREGFNPDSVEETAAALESLCKLFGVEAPTKRQMHDGKSPIIANAATSSDRFAELWELLVPSSGHCKTVQGEVIRIAGRVRDEMYRNGGVNWNRDYEAMVKAFKNHMNSHESLNPKDLEMCEKTIKTIKNNPDSSSLLVNWAVEWVSRNPNPISLPKPSYNR